MAWDFWKPTRPTWAVACSVMAVVAVAGYAGLRWWGPWTPGRRGGLAFGAVAAGIFLVDGLYPLRRRLMAWPFGTAQRWLQFHIYGGLLATLFVLIHTGFRWPVGQMGWWLLVLTGWSAASGALGVALQKAVPSMLGERLSVEAIYERIPELASRLQAEADGVVKGAPEMLERVYVSEIRPALAGVTPAWSHLVDIRGGRERGLAPLREVGAYLAEADQPRLTDLQAIMIEKFELDAQYSLQRILRLWVILHVPPAVALLGLVTAHILMVWYF